MRHEHKKKPLLFLQTLVLAFAALASLALTRADLNEYEVKAMFLINFVKYVDYGPNDQGSIRIGVVGQSEITAALERIASYKKGNGRAIEIISVDPARPQHCHVLFVSYPENRKAAAIAQALAGKGVLIVSEDNKSESRAAGINLIRSENRIKFEINQASIRQSGLRLSGQLQLLAAASNP